MMDCAPLCSASGDTCFASLVCPLCVPIDTQFDVLNPPVQSILIQTDSRLDQTTRTEHSSERAIMRPPSLLQQLLLLVLVLLLPIISHAFHLAPIGQQQKQQQQRGGMQAAPATTEEAAPTSRGVQLAERLPRRQRSLKGIR